MSMNTNEEETSCYLINNSDIKVDIDYKLPQKQNSILNDSISQIIVNSEEENIISNENNEESNTQNDEIYINTSNSIQNSNINDEASISSISIIENTTNDNSRNNGENNNNNSNNSTIHSGMALLNSINRVPSLSEGLNIQTIQNLYRYNMNENNNTSNTNNSDDNTTNINIDQIGQTNGNNPPSQIGPGLTVWFLFRFYSVLKFLWSLIITIIYLILFIYNYGIKSCDKNIYIFSIIFTVLQFSLTISTLILVIYLPTSITRYTIDIRRKVVISERSWLFTMIAFVIEMLMVIVGTILIFNKSPYCEIDEGTTSFVTYTELILIFVIVLYSLICLPIFVLPCFLAFKLLPEYKGISRKVIRKFTNITYNPSEDEIEEAPTCSICMEAYKPGIHIKRLPCNHEFHPDCITLWLETNNTCPICRQSF